MIEIQKNNEYEIKWKAPKCLLYWLNLLIFWLFRVSESLLIIFIMMLCVCSSYLINCGSRISYLLANPHFIPFDMVCLFDLLTDLFITRSKKFDVAVCYDWMGWRFGKKIVKKKNDYLFNTNNKFNRI